MAHRKNRTAGFLRDFLVVVLVSLTSFAAQSQANNALNPVPDPDLSEFEPAVRNALRSAAQRACLA